jgi:hypothetical protein
MTLSKVGLMASGYDWSAAGIRAGRGYSASTYDLGVVILVRVGLHIPNDLVGKQLRELRRLDDVPLDVSESIITESLHDLRDVEKGHVDSMALQCSHRVLNQERMISVLGRKVRNRGDWVDRLPVE